MSSTKSSSQQDRPLVIGIDLGTTYSCVGVYRGNQVEIIANDQGNRTMPSYVAFSGADRLVGESAKNQAAMNPKNTIFDAKRLIGRNFNDATVQSDIRTFPFKVVQGDKGKPMIEVEHKGSVKRLSPEEISAMVLGKMKESAEAFLSTPVKQAVVTVPAYFNDAQRQATKDAGTIAGLDVIRIVNEPTAAALAYGLQDRSKSDSSKSSSSSKDDDDDRKVLIFDLGGGTFDVSLLSIGSGVFEVLATAGDTHLGGEDFDQRIMEHCVKEFKQKHKKDLMPPMHIGGSAPVYTGGSATAPNGQTHTDATDRALRRLRTACERAKRQLSASVVATIEIDSLFDGIDYTTTLTRARFEELNQDYFRKCLEPVEKVLSDAKVSKSDVNEIVLVGGSTRIPKIQELVKTFFGGREPNKSINPDEAVAYGAAVQAAILSGTYKAEGILLDVAPLTLGVEEGFDAKMQPIVKRNTKIPCTASQTFSTAKDNQDTVEIKVYEGERKFVKDNTLLGKFKLTGIPPAPRGVPKIEITFDVDSNGILKVTAVDKATNKTEKIEVKNESSRLTPKQLRDMIENAKKYEAEDAVALERVEARNKLESYLLSLKSTMQDAKLDDNDKQSIAKVVESTAKWLHDDKGSATKDQYLAQLGQVESVCSPIMAKLYSGGVQESESEAPKPPGGVASSAGPKVEEVD